MASQGVFSMELLMELTRQIDELPPAPPLLGGIFGMPVRSSREFPATVTCTKCDGSGDGGTAATYCPACHGAGRIRHEGIITDGDTATVIVSHLPPKFRPSFPFALPVGPWKGIRYAG